MQATADVSPISPLPVHPTSTAPVVAQLQDCAESIVAMAAPHLAHGDETLVSDHAQQDAAEPEPEPEPEAELDDLESDADGETDPAASSSGSSSDPDSEDDGASNADDDHAQEGATVDEAAVFPDKDVTSVASQDPDAMDAVTDDAAVTADVAAAAAAAAVDDAAPLASSGDPVVVDVVDANDSTTMTSPPPMSEDPIAQDSLAPAPAPVSAPAPAAASSTAATDVEIRQLMAEIAAQTAPAEAAVESKPALSLVSGPSSLPPRPPVPSAGASHAAEVLSPTASSVIASQPPYPANPQAADADQLWEQFLSDERKYMADAQWERFPEGSRLFVGNLSSDKVVKREIFDMFYLYGRIAQIAPKSSYGFVQYFRADDALRAQQALEGATLKDRKIHIEVSRIQKKEKRRSPDRERDNHRDRGRRANDRDQFSNGRRDDYRPGRSPQRPDSRGGSGGGGGGRDRDRDRDSQPPFGRDRRDRRGGRRSRSPAPYRGDDRSMRDRDYRRRSPSPYGRDRGGGGDRGHDRDRDRDRHRQGPPPPVSGMPGADLDMPPRYGSSVPDVEIFVQPNVRRELVAWVDETFKARSLRTDVMFVTPQTRDVALQRQILEGVNAVVEIDQSTYNKVAMQVFDRSSGSDKVGFEQYRDLEPHIAVEVVIQSKHKAHLAQLAAQAGHAQHQQHQHLQHGQLPQHAAQHHPAYPPQIPPAYPPQAMPSYAMQTASQPYAAHQAYAPHGMPQNPDLASLMGQTDPATLHRLLSTLQNKPAQGQPQQSQGQAHAGQQAAAAAYAPHIDPRYMAHAVQATSQPGNPAASAGGSGGGSAAPASAYGPQAYPPQTNPAGQPQHSQQGVAVHDIMAQLARIR